MVCSLFSSSGDVSAVSIQNVAKGREALGNKDSPLHILKPTGLDVQLHKCSIDDLRLPRLFALPFIFKNSCCGAVSVLL